MPRPARPSDARGTSPLIDERRRQAPGTIRVVVDSRVRIARSDLPLGIEDELKELFAHKNPDRDRAKRLAKAGVRRGPMPPETIATWDASFERWNGQITFPRGGLLRVLALLESRGLRAEVVDERSDGELGDVELVVSSGVELMPHQTAMVLAAEREQTCVLRAATGVGKTWAGFAIAAKLRRATLVLVPTEVIFDQWVKDAERVLGIARADLGIIKGSMRRVRPLTIASLQTFTRIADSHARTFGTVIFDEVHKAPSATAFAAIDPLAARYRIGVSADERRKDRKEFMTYDAFGDVAFEFSRERAIEAGVIVETEIRMIPTSFEAPWYVELDDAEKGSPEAHDRLLREMRHDRERNALASGLALEEMREGRPTIVFVHRVDHAFALLGAIASADPRAGSCVGEQPRERASTLAAFKAGSMLCAVGTYQSIGTGADLPGAERGVCATPIHTNRGSLGQVLGRICRKDRSAGATKTGARLLYLWDARVFGASPLRNLLRWNKGRVKVLVGDRWVDGREHLLSMDAEREAAEDEQPELFADPEAR